MVSSQAARLDQVLIAASKAGAALAIIDTAPHSENAALAAARVGRPHSYPVPTGDSRLAGHQFDD